MTRTTNQRLEALREKGAQEDDPFFRVLDSLEEAIAHAEGMKDVWETVQRKLGTSLSGIAGDFGLPAPIPHQ